MDPQARLPLLVCLQFVAKKDWRMIIIDIEASSLSEESYPIEIGWAHRHDPNQVDEFLIRPEPTWTDWAPEAQAVHGIAQEELRNHGISVHEAINRLNRYLEDKIVYSDRPGSELNWLIRLYRAGGFDSVPFHVRPVTSLLPPSKVESFWRRLGATSTPHRALADARRIIKTLNYYGSD